VWSSLATWHATRHCSARIDDAWDSRGTAHDGQGTPSVVGYRQLAYALLACRAPWSRTIAGGRRSAARHTGWGQGEAAM